MSGVCWGRVNSPVHRRIQTVPSERLGKIKSSWKQTMLAWWMAFGCCHVVAAGIVFLESLLKTSAWGKALRSHRVSWGCPLAFLIGFLELCSDEMKSQIEKGVRWPQKGSEEKIKFEQSILLLLLLLLCFEAMHVLFEPLKFTAWGEERGLVRTGHSFTQSRTSLYHGSFNTQYCLFNHPATAPRDGLPGRSALGLGCCGCVWGQDLSLVLLGKAAPMVLSKQPGVHPTRNDSSMCSGPLAIPATPLGRVAQPWVTIGTAWLDQSPLQMAAVTCLYPHVASRQ